MARNYRNRDLVFVTLPQSLGSLKYGFQSGLKDTDRPTFGQTLIDANTSATGLIIGANAPKPHRATLKEATGSTSSFCSADKVAALRAAGATIKPPKQRFARSTNLSTAAFVEINGIKYAWNMPKGIPAGADPTALGVANPDINDLLVFGASFPKPARAQILVSGSGNEAPSNMFSTFVDPTKEDTLPAGWVIVSPRKASLNM